MHRLLRAPQVAALAATTLVVGGLSATAAGAPTATSSGVLPSTSTATTNAQATLPGQAELTKARKTGVPVEVLSETTESTRVMARPDGKFELTSTLAPVRARTSHGWADIDTTLAAAGPHTFAPKVTLSSTTIYADGSRRIASIGSASKGIDLSWESALPTPSIAGDTATYRNVRPGVDLVITAVSTGYQKTLVVKTAEAASDLAARPAVFSASTHGMQLKAQRDGALTATGADGDVEFVAAAPKIWDSNAHGSTEQTDARQPGNATVRRVTPSVKAVGRATQIELAVPAEVLRDATTRYPLYLDPSIGSKVRTQTWTVHSGGWDYTSVSDPTEPMRVGYCGYTGCTSVQGNARSFFNFDTTALTGKATTAHVYTASVKAYQIHNGSGSASQVNLAKATGGATSYPGPVGTVLDNYSSACDSTSPCYNTFDNSNVIAYLQNSANTDDTSTYFALSAPAENNAIYWKKFSSSSSSGATNLTVVYDFPPSVAATPSLASDVVCSGQPTYVHDATPTVSSKATTYAGTSVKLNFEIWNYPIGSAPAASGSATGASNTTINWTAPTLPQGDYNVRVYAESVSTETAATPNQTSGWSAWTPFTIDTTAPNTFWFGSSSYNYPSEFWGSAQDKPGVINFSTGDESVAVSYSIDSAGGEPAPTDTTCSYSNVSANGMSGTRPASGASVTPPTTLSAGRHTIYYKTYDAAHNVAPVEKSYSFYVSPGFGFAQPTTIEAEATPPTQPAGQSGYVYREQNSSFSAGYSENLVANAPGAKFHFTINAPQTAYYALGLYAKKSTNYANLAFQIDGSYLVDATGKNIVVDTHNTTGYYWENVYQALGGTRLTTGTHTLTVVMVSTNGTPSTYNNWYGPDQVPISNYNDNGYSASIDTITVAPISWVSFTSLQAAFNNKGISTDGSTSADFELKGSNLSLSRTALSTVGFTQGQTFTIAQVAPYAGPLVFDIPTANTQGNDNAVASGQTIDLKRADGTYPKPPGVDWENPGYVNLLLASTCGTTVSAPSRALSIELTSSVGQTAIPDVLVSAVPDWKAPPNDTGLGGHVTTDHINNGTTPTSTSGTLYVAKFAIPADYYNYDLKSVTLPRVGTDFTKSCNTTALHVLGMNISAN